ncbi:zinc finger CCCH domain-containing protein 6-like [Andrographis paniculata]|uniref:zinc finger CCCH domain-containing protein 6-like n=1 Tax=Andrographis paniculata TaxID=175694 RepID=UPI0021E77E8B|nr:zinc finger CCCH domain-containing protein 6-like [Andrographis paniculata]
MGGSQKSKRVSWASDVNLRQVRLFLSEESPSQVGTGIQDHLQAKTLLPGQPGGAGSDENLPPGFEEIQPANPWAAKLSQIPVIKWKSPPRFEINSDWHVVAGEESEETETQNQREIVALEAIYPRSTSIPPNPSVSDDAEDSTMNEQFPPLVPITAVEDEDAAIDSDTPPAGVEPGVVAAAEAALSSYMSRGDQSNNLIDRDLLIKILSDPKMIGQLVANQAAATSSTTLPPLPPPPSSSFHAAPAIGTSTMQQHMVPGSRHSPSPTTSILCPPTTSAPYGPNTRNPARPPVTGPFYPPIHPGTVSNVRASSSDAVAAASRDINYYKSLIQQHGSTQPLPVTTTSQEIKMREPKPKMSKPCIYFNTPRGCRNGANCTYLHETTAAVSAAPAPPQQRVSGEVQSAKRVKTDI